MSMLAEMALMALRFNQVLSESQCSLSWLLIRDRLKITLRSDLKYYPVLARRSQPMRPWQQSTSSAQQN